jgi:hypothetical protein
MGCLVCIVCDMLKPVDEKHKQELIEELWHDLEQYHPK